MHLQVEGIRIALRGWASLVAQRVKHLPMMQETKVRSLGWEDSPGEGNGNPLQYSCLEDPMDRGAWWATVHRVIKESDTTEQLHTSEDSGEGKNMV